MRKTLLGMLERPAVSVVWALLLLGIVGMAGGAAPARAQATGAISGRVITLEGDPVTDAQVTVAETRRRTSVGGDGSFSFSGLAPGEYLIEVASPRLGSAIERVTVTAGGTAEVTLNLDLTIHREEIVVTASPDARSQNEIAQPTSVLDEQELDRQRQPTLGETLNREPGVTSTFFGMGASRPVIRGLGGDRIRVLEGGIGVGDASSTSPDHAVSSDPLAAERIEVLRGPATLLYGSSAVGGVVNVIDSRIPERVPEERVTGTVELRGGSVADERGGAASVTGGSGGAGRFAWHVDVLKRETEDYEIPDFAESSALRASEAAEGEEHEGEEVRGRLPNSATDSEAGTIGVSYIVDGGFFGVAVGGLDSLYGIPGGHEHAHGEGEEGEGEEEEEAVRIDLEQRRFDLRGGVTRPFGFFRGANLRFGRTDYEHQELEGEEVGTLFTNDSWEGRLELLQRPYGPVTGSVGFQAQRRDFAAVGEEAFVPPSETDSRAVFTFQEVAHGPWRFQLGGRYEAQDTSVSGAGAGEVRDRSFDGLSGSLGLVWQPVEGYTFGLAVARSTKLPNAEELFSNGPHLATNAFELGDPNLEEETSLSADLSLRKTAGRVSGEITLFANRFGDFIFQRAAGEEEDGLAVFQYTQADAEFRGAELTGVVQLFHTEPHHFDLEVGADFVRAELRATGEPLPRIPPRRYRLGIHYRGDRMDGLVEATRVEEQDRVAAFETPTEGYTTLNANLSYRIFTSRAIYDLLLRGTNLTNEEARNHVSFLKDRVPLPGRDLSLALRLTF